MSSITEVSVFVDESGSFDPDRLSSRLFQAADVICTLELARAKLDTPEGLSESERTFFGGERNFKKNYLKLLDRKLFR